MTVPVIVFVVATAASLVQWNSIYFRMTPEQACRAIYGTNPFPEAVAIGRYLEAHCAPDAWISVLGSEPEIFFYSHRRSATGHICTYPLVESQPYASGMRSEMIQDIEKANPELMVFVNVQGSWMQTTTEIDSSLFEWFDTYQREHLKLVGLVEIYPDAPTQYHWFNGATNAFDTIQTNTEPYLAIFQRRSS